MKRFLLLAFSLALAFIVAGCGGGNGPEPPSDEQQINVMMDSFCAAFIDKDANTISSLCSYPFTYQGSAIANAGQLQGLLQASFDLIGTIQAFELNNRVITITETSVSITCDERIQIDGLETTKTATMNGAKDSGGWKAVSFSDI